MKKNAGYKRTIILMAAIVAYALIAGGIVFLIVKGGRYPAGTDTMAHIYKGKFLYRQIQEGNWYPLYDSYWFNGVQPMRCWGLLPIYVLALCQAICSGNAIWGYLLFVGIVFFGGAISWLFIGKKKERMLLGFLLGILWFFMPNNLYALFVEGNLPRALTMVVLPLFFHFCQEYLFEEEKKALWMVALLYALIALCHIGYACILAVAMLFFVLVKRIFTGKKGKSWHLMYAMLSGILLLGIWLYPALKSGALNTDSTKIMSSTYQELWVTLNPIQRLTEPDAYFYFGLAAVIVALFGLICSKKKSMIGFATALLLLLFTTKTVYLVISKLSISRYAWTMRFFSIALCMILYSLLEWKTLRKWMTTLCVILLSLDVIPSLSLLYAGEQNGDWETWKSQIEEEELLDEARELTNQRIAMMDASTLGAMPSYLLADDETKPLRQTFGTGWQTAATSLNVAMLNEAMQQGCYLYLFDRLLELGNDTVIVKTDQLYRQEYDVDNVVQSAKKIGYQLVKEKDGFLLFHIKTPETFGTKTEYSGIGIGTSASLLALRDPDVKEGESNNLNDYTYDDLSKYKIIYLAGFTYDKKEKAEQLLLSLAEEGIVIVINGDGIPINPESQNREFLGVTCQSVLFENGYPILYTKDGAIDPDLFDSKHRKWQTVYLDGLDNVEGNLYENGICVDFLGTAKSENIHFIGLNLNYHYALTGDEQVGELIHRTIGVELQEAPKREIVPLEVSYGTDKITIVSEYDDVNTTLANQDIFTSKTEYRSKNQLLYVNRGKTELQMSYPYLMQGVFISILGIALILFSLPVKSKKVSIDSE